MDYNRAQSIAWIVQDENRSELKDAIYNYWCDLRLDDFPSGLDYFILDCSISCSSLVTFNWLGISLGVSDNSLSAAKARDLTSELEKERIQLLISQMTFSRRRRHKMDPKWNLIGQQLTNRVNRVQHRALKLTLDERVLA